MSDEILETTSLHGCETRSKDGRVEFSEIEHRKKMVADWHKKHPWAAENELQRKRLEIEMELSRIEMELSR
jgi:hypothetical protein